MAYDPSQPVSVNNPIIGAKGAYSAFDANGNPTQIVVNGQSVPIGTMADTGVYAADGSQAYKASQTGGKLVADTNNNQSYYQNANGTTSTYWDPNQAYNPAVTYTPNPDGSSPVAGPGTVAPTPTGVSASVLAQPYGTPGTPGAPTPSTIGDPIGLSSGTSQGGSFTPPTPQAGTAVDTFNTSLAGNLATSKAQLDAAYNQQIASYQAQIKDLNAKQADLQQLQDAGMLGEKNTMLTETAAKQAALDLEQKQFQENYDANQKLVGELDTLLTQGNQIVEDMKNTTGLASIMNPRIAQTMSDVAARAGVIQAVMAARNNQIGVAQNQLSSSLNALTSIYSDQTNYYKSVVNYYEQLKQDNQGQIDTLSKDEKTYIDAKIGQLENAVTNAQNTANIITKAMLDPSTALAYAQAGITLNDTPAQIGQKLATYQYAQEVADQQNKMTSAGYTTTPIAGAQPVTIVDSKGVSRNYYKPPADGGYTLGTNQVRFDANGNVVASGPASSAAATPAQGTNGTSSPTPPAQTTTTLAGLEGGKTFSNGSFQFTPQQYQQAQSILTSTTTKDANGNPNMGADGYVNPQVYLDLLAAWNKGGGLTSDFLTLFPVKKYVNPANSWPQIIALGGGTKPKATSSSSSSSAQTP